MYNVLHAGPLEAGRVSEATRENAAEIPLAGEMARTTAARRLRKTKEKNATKVKFATEGSGKIQT